MSMTEEQVNLEFKETLHRAPTEDEMQNWTRYGTDGQIRYELKPGKTTSFEQDGKTYSKFDNGNVVFITDEDGERVQSWYMAPDENLGKYLTTGSKVGQAFYVSDAAAEGLEGKGLKKTSSSVDGFQLYYQDARGGGLLGGTIGDLANQVIPHELLPVLDTFTLNQGSTILGGAELHDKSMQAGADLTGLKAEEFDRYLQTISDVAVGVAASLTGPLAPVVMGAYGAEKGLVNQQAGRKQDWADVGFYAASGFLPGLAQPAASAGWAMAHHDASFAEAAGSAGVGYGAGYLGFRYGGYAGFTSRIAGGYLLHGSDYDPTGDIIQSVPSIGRKGNPDATVGGYTRAVGAAFRDTFSPSYWSRKGSDILAAVMPKKQKEGFVLSRPSGSYILGAPEEPEEAIPDPGLVRGEGKQEYRLRHDRNPVPPKPVDRRRDIIDVLYSETPREGLPV